MSGYARRRRRLVKYRQMPHTADVAYRIQGTSLAEIYVNAAEALMATLTDRRRLRPKETRRIEVEAPDREALLVELAQLFAVPLRRERLFGPDL